MRLVTDPVEVESQERRTGLKKKFVVFFQLVLVSCLLVGFIITPEDRRSELQQNAEDFSVLAIAWLENTLNLDDSTSSLDQEVIMQLVGTYDREQFDNLLESIKQSDREQNLGYFLMESLYYDVVLVSRFQRSGYLAVTDDSRIIPLAIERQELVNLDDGKVRLLIAQPEQNQYMLVVFEVTDARVNVVTLPAIDSSQIDPVSILVRYEQELGYPIDGFTSVPKGQSIEVWAATFFGGYEKMTDVVRHEPNQLEVLQTVIEFLLSRQNNGEQTLGINLEIISQHFGKTLKRTNLIRLLSLLDDQLLDSVTSGEQITINGRPFVP